MPNTQLNKQRYRRQSEPGAVPGTLAPAQTSESSIRLFTYTERQASETIAESFADARNQSGDADVAWIDVVGVGNVELLKEFASLFQIHELTLEDVINVHQRPKSETFDNYEYLVTRLATNDETINSQQLSIFRSGKFVVTFHEKASTCLDPLRQRILQGKGTIRRRSGDYLVYAILDSIIDHYYPIVDSLGERLDALDEALVADGEFSLSDTRHIRNQLRLLGRWLRPNREVLNLMIRDDSSGMSEETKVFLRDCYDHVIQLQESIEMHRELCSDIRDYHLSEVGNRTNEVMKTLTIVSTIFIPLSFIAGVYGMNFEAIPEYKWKFGYVGVLGLMGTVAICFFAWFRRRGWF